MQSLQNKQVKLSVLMYKPDSMLPLMIGTEGARKNSEQRLKFTTSICFHENTDLLIESRKKLKKGKTPGNHIGRSRG